MLSPVDRSSHIGGRWELCLRMQHPTATELVLQYNVARSGHSESDKLQLRRALPAGINHGLHQESGQEEHCGM